MDANVRCDPGADACSLFLSAQSIILACNNSIRNGKLKGAYEKDQTEK